MWRERQTELLKGEIEAILASLATETDLSELVQVSLGKVRGSIVEAKHNRPWSLLPLIACEAISGHYEHALPAAVALEFLRASAEVFDDIEDEDNPNSIGAKYSSAIATNVATTLLILAERTITQLRHRGVSDDMVIRVLDTINSYYASSCAGQHLDLSQNRETPISEDEYLEIARMKSASTTECAGYVGALLGGANQEAVDMFALFGQYLGMASQIANDIQGIVQGNDIAKRKLTLPIIYAVTQASGKTRRWLKLAFRRQPGIAKDVAEIRDWLFQTGAIHYAAVKMELYNQMALDILSSLEMAGTNTERLRLFLE
jgi:geranylgeranyl pyrophosphate synthase